jgi:hypothetical protein
MDLLDGFKQDLPANGSKKVGRDGGQDRGEQPSQVNILETAEKQGPIKFPALRSIGYNQRDCY